MPQRAEEQIGCCSARTHTTSQFRIRIIYEGHRDGIARLNFASAKEQLFSERIVDGQRSVDVVIPVFGERPKALAATLSACLKQTYPIAEIIGVDDGSPEPVRLPDSVQWNPQVRLLRLQRNQGISVARNAGITQSKAVHLACINTEILPDPDWLATCVNYLFTRPTLAACYTRMVPSRPDFLLSRWRMRFLEGKFGEITRPTDFAPGHAVVFRKEAVDSVGGYDPSFRLHHEDSDICHRMRTRGWETHYIATSRCVSIQHDSLRLLTKKILRETGWYSRRRAHCRTFTFTTHE